MGIWLEWCSSEKRFWRESDVKVSSPRHTQDAQPQFHCRQTPSWQLSRFSWSHTLLRVPFNEIHHYHMYFEEKREMDKSLPNAYYVDFLLDGFFTWTVVRVFLPFLCWILRNKENVNNPNINKLNICIPCFSNVSDHQRKMHKESLVKSTWYAPLPPDRTPHHPCWHQQKGQRPSSCPTETWRIFKVEIGSENNNKTIFFSWIRFQPNDFKMRECLIWILPGDQVCFSFAHLISLHINIVT